MAFKIIALNLFSLHKNINLVNQTNDKYIYFFNYYQIIF
jgi:hypothetical protein